MIVTIDLVSNKRSVEEVERYRWGNMLTHGVVDRWGNPTDKGEFLIWEGDDFDVRTVQDRLLSGLIGSRIFDTLAEAVLQGFDSHRFERVS